MNTLAPVTCGDCGSEMELRSSRYGQFYGCIRYPSCDGTHGANPDGTPKGVPADRETRSARIAAHAAFDPLWKDAPGSYEIEETGPDRARVEKRIRQVARGRAYRWLEHAMGMESSQSHIGSFGLEDCLRVVEVCRDMDASKVRAWWKARKGGVS